MKRLVAFLCFITCCSLALSQTKTARRCLREKVIMFPELTANSWVKLHANESISQSELSVCLRFYTDKNTQKLSLFSLATPSHPQDFSLSWSSDTKEYQMFIHDKSVQFKGLPFNLNQWNSVCATWEAKTGLAQIFVNEVASIKKAVGSTEPFKGEPVIVLGQYQTQYDGGFSQSHIFQGFLSDVHVHGQVLTPRQIKIYMVEKSKFKLGDYISWRNLKHTIFGSAQIEEMHHVTFYTKEENV